MKTLLLGTLEEMSNSEEEMRDVANETVGPLLPNKSKGIYELCYKQFTDWRQKNNVDSLSEDTVLAYFTKLAETFKSSTLWKTYSMLKTTISIKHNINIADYLKLKSFLKVKSDGYQAKKSKVLSAQEVNTFIKEAPNETYLGTKVALIVGVMGACRKNELYQMKVSDVQDLGSVILINIPDIKTNTSRNFTITGEYCKIFKKYFALRPTYVKTNSLFLNYQKGKCTTQVVGINKFSALAKNVATYLKLKDPEKYTGHCIRRTSATMLIDSGGDLTELKRHGGWKSSQVAEGSIENLLENKLKVATKIMHHVKSSGEFSNPQRQQNISLEMASTSTTSSGTSNSSYYYCLPVQLLDAKTILQPSTSTTAPATTDPLIKLEEPSCSRIQEPGIDTTLEFLPEPSEQPVVNVAPKPKPIYKGRKDRIYCRLCLKTSNKNSLTPLSIHDFNYPGKSDAFKKKKAEKVEEIHKMIKFCLPFFDSLTFNPIICSICLARLRSSYDFANECLKNQRLVEKYADMYGTTERVININEMVESKFALSEDESDSDTDTEDTTQSIPKVTRSSTRVSKQIIDEDHSHEDSPATKKQKIYNESREDSSLASSNEDTPFIKTEPYEEFLAQDMPIRDIDPDGIDNITDESMIKIEPEYIDAPDFIKSEPVDDLHVENEIFNKRTGIGTEIQEQHSRFPKIENVVLDTGTNVPSVTREPVFMNVDSSLEATTSDLN